MRIASALAQDETVSATGSVAVAAEGQTDECSAPRHAVELQPSLGRYLPIEELGRGGMGVVLRAYDPRLQREVALKLVRADELDTNAQEHLLREAQSMAKLSHPNIVAVYDAERLGSTVVVAMEYVRGTTLKDWLTQPRPWRDVIAMFQQAGRGLAAAHAAGLLHRDFKPANVLVGEDGRARVADFGLARVHDHTASNAGELGGAVTEATKAVTSIAGTPRYMAPEQHARKPLQPASDQYAFCVALWEALTSERPFADADSKLRGAPPWPRHVSVPVRVRHAMSRGLAVEPAMRWPSMEALLAQLAHDPTVRRRRWITGGAILGALAMSGVAWDMHRQRLAQRCSGAEAQLVGIWDGERLDAVQRAFASTGVGYASEAYDKTAAALDDYAASWAGMHRSACEATSIRDEQPAAVLDLRMACLHRARVGLQAVTDLLVKADAPVVEKTQDLLAGLDDIARCADVEALQAEVAPPPHAEAEAVENIRVRLAEVKALQDAGKFPEAFELITPLAAAAEGVEYVPVRTEVLVQLARAQASAGKHRGSAETYKKVLHAALMSRQWSEAVFAASQMVRLLSWYGARHEEALAYAEAAKGLLPLVDESAEATLRGFVAAALERQGRYAEAEAEKRRAIAITERGGEARQLDLATWRASLGYSLASQGRLLEADAELRAALALRQKLLPKDHTAIARSHEILGTNLFQRGLFLEAEAELRTALAMQERALGPDHLETAYARLALARVLGALGSSRESEALHRAALTIQRARLGNEHIELLPTLTDFSVSLVELGRYAEAEATIREALSLSHKLLGTDNHDVAARHSALSLVLVRQERYLEAEVEARTALAIQERAPERKALVASLAHNNLAGALNGQGRFEEAEREFRTGLAAASRSVGPEHPILARIRNSLGVCLERQGRYEEAEAEQRAALEHQTKRLSTDHPHIAITQARLGRTLLAQGRQAEAEAEFREALALQGASGVENHPDIAEMQGGLARSLLAQGKTREALTVLEPALKQWQDDVRVPARFRAELAFALAQALWEIDGDRVRARRLALQAREVLAGNLPLHRREHAEVEAWLRTHRA